VEILAILGLQADGKMTMRMTRVDHNNVRSSKARVSFCMSFSFLVLRGTIHNYGSMWIELGRETCLHVTDSHKIDDSASKGEFLVCFVMSHCVVDFVYYYYALCVFLVQVELYLRSKCSTLNFNRCARNR